MNYAAFEAPPAQPRLPYARGTNRGRPHSIIGGCARGRAAV